MEVREELFSDDGFDCYAWAEEALIESNGRVADLAPLVPQLALLSQSLATTIHGTLQQLATSVPQLQTQLDALQAATTPLQTQLDAVVAHVGGSSDDTASLSWSSSHRKQADERALAHLVTLHDAKQRLQACSHALVEAAKWEKNVRICFAAVDELASSLFASSPPPSTTTDGQSLADCVVEMQRSLKVLGDLPGAADRTATMHALSKQIEQKLTPALRTLLQTDSGAIATIQQCLAIFQSIDRADVVHDAYCTSRASHVHRVWYAFDSDETEWLTWLERFYNDVLALFEQERDTVRDVFGTQSVAHVLVALMTSTFTPLRASIADRVRTQSSVRASGSSTSSYVSLALLVRAFEQSLAFATRVATLLRSVRAAQHRAFKADVEADDAIPDGDAEAHDVTLQCAFSAYEPVFRDFARVASDALSAELVEVVPTFAMHPTKYDFDDDPSDDPSNGASNRSGTGDALVTFAQQLEDAAPNIWTRVDTSLALCYAFSAGAAFPDAVIAGTTAVQLMVHTLNSALPAIRQVCKLTPAVGPATSQDGDTTATLDWSTFHAALALLRACGALETELCSMEIRVRARVQEQLVHILQQLELERHASATSMSMSHSSGTAQRELLADVADASRIGAVVASAWLHGDATRLSAFTQFCHEHQRATGAVAFDASTRSCAVLFEDAQLALREWTSGVQLLTFDTVFVPIARLLARVPTLESWAKTPDASLGDLPTFSTLPQEYITAVADLLLSLLPQLEQFAESSSLECVALASLGAYDNCVLTHWRRLGALLQLTDSVVDACAMQFAPESESETDATMDSTGGTATDFVDLWTAAVASSAVASLLSAICAIPSLSLSGAQQLSADLSYFTNVLSAVSGEPNALIDDLRCALALDADGHAAHVAALQNSSSSSSSSEREHERGASYRVLVELHECLVRKRGVEVLPSSAAPSLSF